MNDGSSSSSIVVLGAGGFLGRAFVDQIDHSIRVKAVIRKRPRSESGPMPHVAWHVADLAKPEALEAVLDANDVVVNLAFDRDAPPEANVRLIDSILRACIARGARRMVHCSTAVVAGDTGVLRIDENTVCSPRTAYQRTKLGLEQRVLAIGTRELDIGVLRPTMIVGAGGQNLVKLARSLLGGHLARNYARASLFGTRPMHIVPVRTVAGALVHLATLDAPLEGNVYIAAADEDRNNNFRDVERILMQSLRLPARMVPPVPVPRAVLTSVLTALRRAETNTRQVFSSAKLRATGFSTPDTVESAVREFGAAFRTAADEPRERSGESAA